MRQHELGTRAGNTIWFGPFASTTTIVYRLSYYNTLIAVRIIRSCRQARFYVLRTGVVTDYFFRVVEIAQYQVTFSNALQLLAGPVT